MVTARIELKGACSHSRRSVSYRRGVVKVTSDPKEIAYCRANAHLFSVITMSPPPPPVAEAVAEAPKPKAKPRKRKAAATEDVPL